MENKPLGMGALLVCHADLGGTFQSVFKISPSPPGSRNGTKWLCLVPCPYTISSPSQGDYIQEGRGEPLAVGPKAPLQQTLSCSHPEMPLSTSKAWRSGNVVFWATLWHLRCYPSVLNHTDVSCIYRFCKNP